MSSELVADLFVYIAFAGSTIGGAIGFFLNASGPAKDGAWLKLARETTWGVIAGAIGGSIGLVVGELVLGVFQGGLVGGGRQGSSPGDRRYQVAAPTSQAASFTARLVAART